MPFLKVAEMTCFGVVDIIASYFGRRTSPKEKSESSEDSDTGILEKFSDKDLLGDWYEMPLKRKFTIKSSDTGHAELLMLSK